MRMRTLVLLAAIVSGTVLHAQTPQRAPDVILDEVQKLVDELKALFQPPQPPPVEVCGNGLDDNADGQVDEGCTPQPPPPTCAPGATCVTSGAELTTALQAGGRIILAKGVYTGNFTVSKPTVIEGETSLTGRVSIGGGFDANGQPVPTTPHPALYDYKLVASDKFNPVLTILASDVSVRGVLVTGVAPDRVSVLVGFKPLATDPISVLPSRVYLDQIAVQGTNGLGHRGVEMHGADMRLTNSHIDGILEQYRQSQGFWACYGPGPYLVENNYIEASGENILFGGDDPNTPGLVPSDLVIRGNFFFKPQAWRQKPGSVANVVELKSGQRVLIEGNILDGSWTDIQTGSAAVFTVRNQYGKAPWSVVQDVIFRKNIVRNFTTGYAVSVHHDDNNHPSQPTRNITVDGNLILGPNGVRLIGGVDGDVVVTNNTMPTITGAVFTFTGKRDQFAKPVLTFTGNVFRHGIFAMNSQDSGSGTYALRDYTTSYTVKGNVIEQSNGTKYVWGRWPGGQLLMLDTVGALVPLLDADYHYIAGGVGY